MNNDFENRAKELLCKVLPEKRVYKKRTILYVGISFSNAKNTCKYTQLQRGNVWARTV